MNFVTIPRRTDFVDHFDHLLQLVRADVGAVSEPEIDEHPLAEEVLALGGFVVVIDERERAAERRPAHRLDPFFLHHCKENNRKQLKSLVDHRNQLHLQLNTHDFPFHS